MPYGITGKLNGLHVERINNGIGGAAGDFNIGLRLSALSTDAAGLNPCISIGSSSVPLTLLTYADHGFEMYTTCASTGGSTSVEPFYVKSILTGAGEVGGRGRFHTYTNVALGSWCNALKAFFEFGASGRTTGLASAFCAEIQLSAGCTGSSYAALEAEIVMPANAVTGQQTAFLYCNASGAAASTFDTNGYFLHVGDGITAAAGKFCGAYYQSLKCYFTDSTTTRYMVLSQTEDGVGLGTSGSPMAVTMSGTKPFSLYTTSASTDASTNLEPFYVSTVMTGAGQVGGRARFHSEANVSLGAWSNALKASFTFGASGRSTGLGSAFCAELTLSAGTTGSSYAAIEGELVLGSGASTGQQTSFIYLNATGTGASAFDTSGYLFHIGDGITAAAGKFCSATYQTLKCYFSDSTTTRYAFLSQIEDGIGLGNSVTAQTLTAGTPMFQLYSTCASQSGSTNAEPFYVKSTMTGAGGVGGRARFHLYTAVALGSWCNALKGYAEFGASGRTTGLASAVCAEMKLPSENLGTGGAYFPLEIEYVAAGNALVSAGAPSGNHVGFIYMQQSGDANGDFDTNGFIMHIVGMTAGASNAFRTGLTAANINAATTAALRIAVDNTTYYIPIATATA